MTHDVRGVRADNGVQVFVCLRARKGFFLYKYTKKVDIWSFFLYKNRQVYGHLNPRTHLVKVAWCMDLGPTNR